MAAWEPQLTELGKRLQAQALAAQEQSQPLMGVPQAGTGSQVTGGQYKYKLQDLLNAVNSTDLSDQHGWARFKGTDGSPLVVQPYYNSSTWEGDGQNRQYTRGSLAGYEVFSDPGDFGGGWLTDGPEAAKMNGRAFDALDANGNYTRSGNINGWSDGGVMGPWGALAVIAMPFAAAAAGLGAAGAAGAAEGGAVAAGGAGASGAASAAAAESAAGGLGAAGGSGAFLGEGVASGIGAWDGALAGAGAGGAGAGGLAGLNAVDLTGTGLPLDSAGSVIGSQAGGGTLSNAAIEQMIQGAGLTTSQVLNNPSLLSQLASKLGTNASTLTSLLGAGANLVGGALTANAAGNAADAQLKAQQEASALQEPWRQAGMKALNRMQEVLGIGGDPNAEGYNSQNKPFTADSLNADPSYQFRKDEGMNGLMHAYAGKGNFLSGGALKGIDRYGQDYASTEYGNAWNRDQATKTNSFNRLASVAGTGQTAANTQGGYVSNAGDAKAAGTVGSSNAWTDAINGAYKTWQVNQANDQMQPYYNALTQRLLAPK